MARFATEISITAGQDYDLNGIAGYTPASGDKIILTPIGPDSTDANSSNDVVEGNIKAYLSWDNTTWKVKVSDSDFDGKILVVIKT